MKIGIIIEPYEENNASGIAHCILNQTEGLLNKDYENEYILYTSKPLDHKRLIGKSCNILIPSSFLGKNLWFLIMLILRKKEVLPDVLIFNMPLLPIVLPRSIKTIPVYYELNAYSGDCKRFFVRSLIMKINDSFKGLAVKRAFHIITPSDGSRKDIIKYFHLNPNKVTRIYLGFQNLHGYTDSQSEFDKYKNHFLFVGKVKYKKNLHNILEGFILLKKKHSTSTNKLILVGDYGGEYYEKLQKRIKNGGLQEDVVFLGYAVKEDLYTLYVNASALIFCTLQEGFGMPIIEAMDLGIPVITSSRAPMNEIGGDVAFIVDPESPKEISDAMDTIMFNKEKRDEVIQKGKERAKLFSWDKHISEFLGIIQSIK